MDFKKQIDLDLRDAMKQKDILRADVLRMIKTSVRNEEIEKGGELEEKEFYAILSRMQKQHEDSIALYTKANRSELTEKEELELRIIKHYLPEQLTEKELIELIRSTIEKTGASGPGDMGKVMGSIMPLVKGRAHGKTVQSMVLKELSG